MMLNLLNSDLDIQQRLRELEQSDLANLDAVRQEATANTLLLTTMIYNKMDTIDAKANSNTTAIATLSLTTSNNLTSLTELINLKTNEVRIKADDNTVAISAQRLDGPKHSRSNQPHTS